MAISHLLTETCTILQRRQPSTMQDAYGNPVIRTTSVSAKTHIQAVAGSVGADGVYYTGKAYLESDTDIEDDDCIEARGKKFWVNSVELHVSPTGSPQPYKSVLLRETAERKVVSSA